MKFSAKWLNSAKIENILNELSQTANPAFQRRVMRVIGGVYLKATEDRFITQRDPSGKSWAKLKKKTIANKRRSGSLLGPTHIGVHKGKLASSIQMRINGHEITIGSDVDYAAEFNFKTKHSPERKFLGRDSRADRKVLEALNRFFSVSFLR